MKQRSVVSREAVQLARMRGISVMTETRFGIIYLT